MKFLPLILLIFICNIMKGQELVKKNEISLNIITPILFATNTQLEGDRNSVHTFNASMNFTRHLNRKFWRFGANYYEYSFKHPTSLILDFHNQNLFGKSWIGLTIGTGYFFTNPKRKIYGYFGGDIGFQFMSFYSSALTRDDSGKAMFLFGYRDKARALSISPFIGTNFKFNDYWSMSLEIRPVLTYGKYFETEYYQIYDKYSEHKYARWDSDAFMDYFVDRINLNYSF